MRTESAKKLIAERGLPFTKIPQEQRVENGRKARLASERKPNGLESILMQEFIVRGMYAEDAVNASDNTIYYRDKRGNKRYIRLTSGRYKLPDFKVKGQRKVIEIFGEYFHSQAFCQPKGRFFRGRSTRACRSREVRRGPQAPLGRRADLPGTAGAPQQLLRRGESLRLRAAAPSVSTWDEAGRVPDSLS